MATTMTDLHNRIHALMPQARSDLAALVACQSVADPRQFPESESLRAAQLVIDDFAAAGMRDARLEQMPDGHPAVFGHIPAPDGAPTVLFYGHYDVEPPLDPTGTAWKSPTRPRSSTWPSPRHYSSPTIPRERGSQPTEAAAPHMTRLALAAGLV